MKTQKKKTTILIAVILFACVFQLHAVFEGRDDKLQDYTSVRSGVAIEPIDAGQKTASLNPNEGGDPRNPNNSLNKASLADFPLVLLLLGGAGYAVYAHGRKKAART